MGSDPPARGRPPSDRAVLVDGGLHRPRVDFFIGAHCNNDCVFCNEGGRLASRRVYTLEEARSLLERAAGLRTVFLTGGEPTLNPALGDFVDLARAYGVQHIALITNGRRLARPGLLRDLLQRGVNEIRISVHGHDAAAHDAHTGVDGSFAQIEAGLEKVAALRAELPVHLIALVVVTRRNLPHLESIYSWAIERGFDRVGFGVVRPSGKADEHFDDVIPRYRDVARRFDAFLARRRFRVDPVNVDSVPPCLLPAQAGFIGARMRLVSLGDAGLVQRDEYWEKVKGPPCERCRLATSCEGVWEGYVERYGWDEMSPVVEPPWGRGDAPSCIHGVTSADDNVPLLSLTDRCNNGCRAGCPGAAAPSRECLPSPEEFHQRLEAVARAGAERVRLGGGEPGLSPHLRQVLTAAQDFGLAVTLCTNARMLSYASQTEALARRGPLTVHTVLFAGNAADHDRVTRTPGSFQQAVDGIRNARRVGWDVEVVLPDSAHDASALAARLEKLGCRVLRKRIEGVDDITG